MARLPYASLLRTIRPTKPPIADRGRSQPDDAPPPKVAEPEPVPQRTARVADEPKAAEPAPARKALVEDPPARASDARGREGLLAERGSVVDEPVARGDLRADDLRARRAPVADDDRAVPTPEATKGEPPTRAPDLRDQLRERVGRRPVEEAEPAPEPTPAPAPAPAPPTSTGTYEAHDEPLAVPTSAFDPDDWSYEPESGLWYSADDGRFHAEPGGPPVPDGEAPTVVPASADLLADAVVVEGLSFDVRGDWLDDAAVDGTPLAAAEGIVFDADDGVFRAGADGPVVGFHEGVLADARTYPNRSMHEAEERSRLAQRVEELEDQPPSPLRDLQLDQARAAHDELDAVDHAYEEFPGPDLLFAGDHWYLQGPGGTWQQMPEGRFLDLREVSSPIGDFLDHELVVGTPLQGMDSPQDLGLVLDGATGTLHAHDPTEWSYDEASQAWVDADGARFDRPDGRALGPDETSDVGPYDSEVRVHDLTAVRAADGSFHWYDAGADAFLDGLVPPLPADGPPPPGPYEYAGPTGHGAPPPLDGIEPGTEVAFDTTTEAFHAGGPDGPIVGFHEAAEVGTSIHNRSGDAAEATAELQAEVDDLRDHRDALVDAGAGPEDLAEIDARLAELDGELAEVADDSPYVDFLGPDLQFVNGTWYAEDELGRFHPTGEGRYLDPNRAQADLGDYLDHELALGTPAHGQVPFTELGLVIDGTTGELHAYDPERWAYDEASQAWVDDEGRRFDEPDGRLLGEGEVSEVGAFDSLVDLDRMALVSDGTGHFWLDVEDGTFSSITSPGVPLAGPPPQGPFTTTADGPHDQPPLDALEPGTVVHLDPETLLYRLDGPDGPVIGFHSGVPGSSYEAELDPRLDLDVSPTSRLDVADLLAGDVRTLDEAEPLRFFQVDGTWYDGDGAPLDLPPNPTVGDLPPALRRAVLADAGLEGAAEAELADSLVLDGDTGELHLFDPDRFTYDPEQGAWVDGDTGEVVEDPLGYDEAPDAFPDGAVEAIAVGVEDPDELDAEPPTPEGSDAVEDPDELDVAEAVEPEADVVEQPVPAAEADEPPTPDGEVPEPTTPAVDGPVAAEPSTPEPPAPTEVPPVADDLAFGHGALVGGRPTGGGPGDEPVLDDLVAAEAGTPVAEAAFRPEVDDEVVVGVAAAPEPLAPEGLDVDELDVDEPAVDDGLDDPSG